ncbi:MAG: copper amine oxidase N-terminal domain-containing protein [Clostridia bacterium]|nr:copper amine oxidase N-terminal domain-containing protein [Clostridia bacterium]
MKRLFCVLLAVLCILAGGAAYGQEGEIKVEFEKKTLVFNSSPIIDNGRTLVQIRPIAEAMGLTIEYEPLNKTVILCDGKTETRFSVGSEILYVNGKKQNMGVKMASKDDYTFIPIRFLVEPFGYEIAYDADTKTVSVDKSKAVKLAELRDKIRTGSGKYPTTYYYQSQEEIELDNNGKGYCWVCSYAMVLSDVTGETVTPADIAEINKNEGYSGNYMSGHSSLVGRFGCRIVPALKESSPYFESFGTLNRNETVLAIETDEDAYNALKEALDNFPQGVIARFEAYPHSMVAVDYDDNYIYFNDPGIEGGEHKKLEETCLKNYKLSDISYIQAIAKK